MFVLQSDKIMFGDGRQNENSVELVGWLRTRARELEKKREFRDAIDCWSRLLDILTRSRDSEQADVTELASIHYHLGMNHRALRDEMKSMYHLKYSIRLNANEARYYQAFGRGFLRGGHWQVAKAQFEKAVRLDPRNISYLCQYSWILLMMGRKEHARFFANKALEIDPKDPKAKWAVIRVAMESRDYMKALRILRSLSGSRAQMLKAECESRLADTIEGAALKILRVGMRMDAQPFHLGHYRWAEDLWMREGRRMTRSAEIPAHVFAAALAWLSVAEGEDCPDFSFEDLLMRFAVSSVEVWPALCRIKAA